MPRGHCEEPLRRHARERRKGVDKDEGTTTERAMRERESWRGHRRGASSRGTGKLRETLLPPPTHNTTQRTMMLTKDTSALVRPQVNIACPSTGAQKQIKVEEDSKVRGRSSARRRMVSLSLSLSLSLSRLFADNLRVLLLPTVESLLRQEARRRGRWRCLGRRVEGIRSQDRWR